MKVVFETHTTTHAHIRHTHICKNYKKNMHKYTSKPTYSSNIIITYQFHPFPAIPCRQSDTLVFHSTDSLHTETECLEIIWSVYSLFIWTPDKNFWCSPWKLHRWDLDKYGQQHCTPCLPSLNLQRGSLPSSVQELPNTESFKRHLKTVLFQQCHG